MQAGPFGPTSVADTSVGRQCTLASLLPLPAAVRSVYHSVSAISASSCQVSAHYRRCYLCQQLSDQCTLASLLPQPAAVRSVPRLPVYVVSAPTVVLTCGAIGWIFTDRDGDWLDINRQGR